MTTTELTTLLTGLWAKITGLVSAKYTKPSSGIPKTDLAAAVQTSLGKADTALQSIPEADEITYAGQYASGSVNDVERAIDDLYGGKATKSELANFCPIIEDTRASAVAAITGVAPFNTLVDGQRIIVKLKYTTSANATLTLTGLTSALPIYARCNTNNNSDITAIYVNGFVAGTFMELIYDATNSRWVCTNYDRVLTYESLTQTRIDTSSSAQCVVTGQLLRSNFYLKSEAMAKRTLVTTGSALTTDTYVDLGTTDTIAPTLPASPSRADEFVFSFVCITDHPNITLPPLVELADGFDWSEADTGVKFQVSIQDNIAAYLVLTPNT